LLSTGKESIRTLAAFERKWDHGPTFFSEAKGVATQLPEELTSRLSRLAASEGLELLAIEVAGTPRKRVVRLVLDRPADGVTLADCETVSRQASALLDAYDPFPGPYTLEASSPGLDRKLYSEHDYSRFTGEIVRIRMRGSWSGPRVVIGALGGLEGGFVRLTGRDGTAHLLPYPEVFETRLAPFVKGEPRVAQRRSQRKPR
jgi:ribosome maturation factor RimP